MFEGWTTTLEPEVGQEQVIALYHDHATHEWFHAEFKTDMGLNRLPLGKFATDHLVCGLAAVAMNRLRIVGRHTLHERDGPPRKALRRRIKTVTQKMMSKVRVNRLTNGSKAATSGCSCTKNRRADYPSRRNRLRNCDFIVN